MRHIAAGALALLFASGCCQQQEATLAEQELLIQKQKEELETVKAKLPDMEALQTKLDETSEKLSTQQDIIDEMKEREAQAEARLDVLKEMLGQFKSMIEAGELEVKAKGGKMTLELPSAILFDLGSAELSEKGKKTLEEVAEVLKGIEGREFQVAGHTDNQNLTPENPFETNWHLSAARAVAVVIFLEEAGVKPGSLSAAGYSQFQPAVPNKGKKNMAKNRRIEITIMPNIDELPDLTDIQRELGEIESREGEAGE